MKVSITISKTGTAYTIASGEGDWIEYAADAKRAFRSAICMLVRDMHDQASRKSRETLGEIDDTHVIWEAYEEIQGLLS